MPHSSRFEDSDAPTIPLQAREKLSFVESAVKELSEKDQQLLRMRHQKGLTFVEIGEALTISADAARMAWGRAIERLKAHMLKHGDL